MYMKSYTPWLILLCSIKPSSMDQYLISFHDSQVVYLQIDSDPQDDDTSKRPNVIFVTLNIVSISFDLSIQAESNDGSNGFVCVILIRLNMAFKGFQFDTCAVLRRCPG